MTTDEDDDLPFDHESATAIAEALRTTSSATAEIVRDHVEFYDEVLPTVLLGEIGRWYWSTAAIPESADARDAAEAVDAVSRLFAAGNQSLQDIVATGLLEALPQPHEHGREVVERLPTPLREELRRMENWTPG